MPDLSVCYSTLSRYVSLLYLLHTGGRNQDFLMCLDVLCSVRPAIFLRATRRAEQYDTVLRRLLTRRVGAISLTIAYGVLSTELDGGAESRLHP